MAKLNTPPISLPTPENRAILSSSDVTSQLGRITVTPVSRHSRTRRL